MSSAASLITLLVAIAAGLIVAAVAVRIAPSIWR